MDHFLASIEVMEFITPSGLRIMFFSLWGGLACHLFNKQFTVLHGMQLTLASQLISSSFLGVLAGIFCQNLMWSEHLTLIIAGISGLTGSNLLHWPWTLLFQQKTIW
ncbi:phage holin family protein [Rahnella bruchi]|uniref:phage holin family protein n=1 Tax=Rahnella bruchi TaxID=1510573 RepID=UPI000EA23BC6|nr:phage holin family protein [Rahnella bruchi]